MILAGIPQSHKILVKQWIKHHLEIDRLPGPPPVVKFLDVNQDCSVRRKSTRLHTIYRSPQSWSNSADITDIYQMYLHTSTVTASTTSSWENQHLPKWSFFMVWWAGQRSYAIKWPWHSKQGSWHTFPCLVRRVLVDTALYWSQFPESLVMQLFEILQYYLHPVLPSGKINCLSMHYFEAQ